MIAYNVNANKKNAYIITGFLYFSSIVCFMITTFNISFKLPLQLFAIVLALFAIQLTLRFISYDFSYSIDDRGPRTLKIYRIQGKKSTLAFGLLFEYIYKIEKVKGNIKKSNEKPHQISNYCGTLLLQDYYLVYYKDEGKDCALKLEINDAFANEIELRIKMQGDEYIEAE